MTTTYSEQELQARFVPFDSLRYSTEAFIDYRIPGCGPKKNYALIGPGVSQNPNQPISLREKHGFQVGGVAMPAGTRNPPHMHFTAEVFLCVNGAWNLHWGFNPERQEAPLSPGDIASVPTWIYRGFESLAAPGLDEGFMFTGLGRDDTGGILWGAQTLEQARAQGVHLTEDYQIIDEQSGGQWNDATMKRLQPMTAQEVSELRSWSKEQMEGRVVRFDKLHWSSRALLDSALPGCGASIAPVIGLGMSEERNHVAQLMNAHGFSIEWLKIPAGGSVSLHSVADKQVVIAKQGEVEISVSNTANAAENTAKSATKIVVKGRNKGNTSGWDTYAMPADVWRSYKNIGAEEALLIVFTAGDHRKKIVWSDEVVAKAAAAGWAIDANSFLALKKFTDRSQR